MQSRGYNVGLVTGDIKYIPDNCDIICCTQEIYNNQYRNYKNATLIIDEFSYIFEDNQRSRVYIDSLFYSKAKNIMICSATFGNVQKIRDYLNKVTRRNFFLYENNERLTTLEYKGKIKKDNIENSLVVAYSKMCCKVIAKNIFDNRIKIYQSLLKSNYDPRKIYKRKILEIADKYDVKNRELMELCTMGVAYYYGSLLPKEKLFIEELFENRANDVVVGTDALALGVNFPIKNVVFAQLEKKSMGYERISKNLFEQLSGRAGRKGYFDKGYVYYCDDLLVREENNDKLEALFFELINSENEDVQVSLTPNVKSVLIGDTTIDEEATFIVTYSTDQRDFLKEKNELNNIVRYIKSTDVTSYYLKKKYPNLNFDLGYDKALENCTQKFKNKFETLLSNLKELQIVFENDIGQAYLEEYSPDQNCKIFVDILMNLSIDDLKKKYCKELRDLLLLKKYILKLPDKYSKNYDVSVLDDEINSIDYTVLNLQQDKRVVKLIDNSSEKKEIEQKKNEQNKKKSIYNCPHYFEKIRINDREYVVILKKDNEFLISEYSSKKILSTRYVRLPKNYKLLGYIKLQQRLEILNKLQLSTLLEEDVDKIEGMKLFLEKGMDRSRRK